MPRNRVDIRCFCRRQPLLAVGGADTKNQPFIQIKAVKAGEAIIHAIIHSGSVSIQCRECKRWHKINIRTEIKRERPEDSLPDELLNSEVLSSVT